MSTFITKADYSTHIKSNILDDITEVDDTKLDTAETMAIEYVKGFLNARYDIDNIFNKTGIARNPIILMYCIDITLFMLHSRINPRKIPAYRKERHDAAKEWLEGVQALLINPPDLPVFSDGKKDYILFGSNIKRTNHIL